MSNTRIKWLAGAVGVVAVGAAILGASGLARALESAAFHPTMGVSPAADRILVAQAEAETALTPVTFSSAQADRGEKQFTKNCVECHGEDLKGGLLGGAPLRGLTFEEKYMYEGAVAGTLFEVMSTTMPPDSPGRYSAAQYADLMAYILKRNGFQAGADLPGDVDLLNTMSMVK